MIVAWSSRAKTTPFWAAVESLLYLKASIPTVMRITPTSHIALEIHTIGQFLLASQEIEIGTQRLASRSTYLIPGMNTYSGGPGGERT